MPPARKTPYAGVTLTRAVRDDLQRVALTMSAQLGRRLSMSAIAAAALAVAERYPDELTAELAASGDADQ
jgi:hypothetical protein